MSQANCFDAPTLKNYLLGKLSDEQSDVVAAHLEACLACEATVSQLDRASDTLTNGLRLPAGAAEPKTDDELQKALDKVQSLEELVNHPTSEVSKTSEVSADRSPLLRDYRLLEPLGSGGMGQVFKAVHTRLDRLVAVKLLPARRLGDEQAVARFQREMRVIGQLSHPAIVQATDAGEVDGTHFLVMEYVEGCDLNTLAKACGPLSVADACEIARQAALGLEYAHQQGIIHRDIKPSNVMLSRGEGRGARGEASDLISPLVPHPSPLLKILDLGLALLSGEQAPVDELTTVGQLMGTLDYMAPEQLEDSHLVGPRADIYALAATLYRLLTGVAPFAKDDRKTPLQKLRALATQTAPPIRERRADIPEDLAAIIDRALRRESAERFASMAEFAAALAPWCAGHDLSQLVGQVSNLPGSAVESLSARRGSLDPAAWLDRRSPSDSLRAVKAEPRSGDLRSVAAAGSGDPRRAPSSPRRALLVMLAVLFFVALGLVITVETNKGTLIVESLRDGVEVRVKKSGKTVEQLELTTGPKSARLASGDYEIEIVGKADGLQIQNGKFVLKRGDTVVAKVTEIPKGQAATDKPAFVAEPTTESPPRKPVEIVDRNAKGMETFEASNPDLSAEKKVREALQKSIEVNFADNPLTDTLRFLEDKTQITFFLESEALTEEGIASDTPITLSLLDKPTTTVLEFLLRPLELAWYIDGGQVVITTASKEKQVFVTRTYPVGKLLPGVRQAVERLRSEPQPPAGQPAQGGGGFGGGFFHVGNASSLAGTLTATLGQFGGGGGAAPAANPPLRQPVIPTDASHFQSLLSESLGYAWLDLHGEGGTCELLHNVLVVRHTRRAHADVESLLRTVEAAFLKPLTEPVEIRPAGYSLEADANVRRQLARKLDVAFTETPLTDTAAWLSDQLGVPVLFDRAALADEGIATDAPVTLQFQGITGDVLLSRLLKPLQLDYDIEHGLLIFTTAAKLQERHVTKVYDVRDLLDRGLHPSRLIAGLQTTTPGPWLATDGEGGSLTLFADTLLIVRQTWPSHDEVAKFLTSLRSQLSDQPEVPRVVKSNPQSTAPDNSATPRPSQPQPNIPTAADNPPTKPASDNQPRYDGKTFDEWLTVLDVERSPARLADAFQALRLLHQGHQAATVAQRVLAVFRQVSPDGAFGDSKNRRYIANDARDALQALPEKIVHAAAADELNKGNTRSRKFVFGYVLTRRADRSTWATQLPGTVLVVSRDSDASIRSSALQWLTGLPLEASPEVTKRFRAALSDNALEVTYWAAYGLLGSEPDTPFVVDALKRLISAPPQTPGLAETSMLRGESMKLVAIMGPRAAAAAPAIAPFLLSRDSFGGLVFWIGKSGGFDRSTQLSIKCLAALALARMGKAGAESLPTIETALKQFQDSAPEPLDPPARNIGGGGMNPFGGGAVVSGSGHSQQISFREFLIGVKARIEDRPAADPKSKPAEVKLEDTLLVQSLLRLLEIEQLLLEEHYGPEAKRPELRELDQKIKAAEEEFNALWKLYDEQRKNAPRRSPGTSSESSTKPAEPAKYLGKTLAEWIDQSVAKNEVLHEAILALVKDASAQDIEPLFNRSLQTFKTERSPQGIKTNARILGLIGRQHFAEQVTQTFLEVLRERFEDKLLKNEPNLDSDQPLAEQYAQMRENLVVEGLSQLPSDKVGLLLQRELKEGSLVGRDLAITYFRGLVAEKLQPQVDQLLPLLLPFVNRQAADVPPAWEKPLRKSVWAVLGSLVSRCTLNESQQRMLVDLAEKAIADPADAADLASNIHDATVFSVLVKLSPKSERLVPTLLKLEAEPRTGVAKAFHTEWTISLLAYLAKQEPKALQALIRLLEDNALDEETRFDAKGGGKASFARSPRAYAIRELGRLGPAARDALPVLKKQLESKNKAVVTAAEKAIQQIETAKDDTKTD